MIDLEKDLLQLEEIVAEASQPSLTLAEKGGLFAAAQAIGASIGDYAEELNMDPVYVSEKLLKTLYFLGAMLGFHDDYDNSTSSCALSANQQISGIRLHVPK